MLWVSTSHQPLPHMATPITLTGGTILTSPGAKASTICAPCCTATGGSSSQPQPPPSSSPVEQAIMNLNKVVGNFVEEHKAVNAQANKRIDIMERTLNKKINNPHSEISQKYDNLQSEISQKYDNLQYSISRLTNQ